MDPRRMMEKTNWWENLSVPIFPLDEYLRLAAKSYQQHEDHILQVQKIIPCSAEEASLYLKIFPGSFDRLLWDLEIYGHFRPVFGYSYATCVKCHRRQWFLTDTKIHPCPYCDIKET